MTEEGKSSVLINCKKCNRLFSSVDGATLCSRCNESADEGFSVVREYIYDNPSSSIKEVSSNTGIESELILRWIREGRIVLSEHANISFCERCDVPTDGGRFCGKCIRELSDGLKKGITADEIEKKGAGMHIREIDRKK
jgi:hypothetical protein